MNKNYMIYPLKTIRITQNYTDTYSHLKHNTGYPKDYPIDDGGVDTGRDPIYCPCDEMKVTAIKGVGNPSITNTIWLVSTTPVVTPTFTDYAFVALTHSNDDDIKNIKVGDIFKRGDVICHEGSDGATANHIHMSSGRGSSSSLEKNTTGAWVVAGDAKRPEEVFYLKKDYHNVIETRGIQFTYLEDTKTTVGTQVLRDSTKNQLEVKISNLNARKDHSLDSEIIGYVNPGIYDYINTYQDDSYLWYNIEDFWVAYNQNWINILEIKKEPRLIFTSKESKKYIIYLKENDKLYLED